jgi:putative transposase
LTCQRGGSATRCHAELQTQLPSGRHFFFTVVTADRRPILTNERAHVALRRRVIAERRRHHFDIVAFVLLPDRWTADALLPPSGEPLVGWTTNRRYTRAVGPADTRWNRPYDEIDSRRLFID